MPKASQDGFEVTGKGRVSLEQSGGDPEAMENCRMIAASTGAANGVSTLASEQADAVNSQSPRPDMAAALRTPQNIISADATIASDSADDATDGRRLLSLVGKAWEGCVEPVQWQHEAAGQA